MMDAKDVRQAAHFLHHCSETAITPCRLRVDRNEAAHLWRDLADSFDNADVKAVQGGTLFKPGCPDCGSRLFDQSLIRPVIGIGFEFDPRLDARILSQNGKNFLESRRAFVNQSASRTAQLELFALCWG